MALYGQETVHFSNAVTDRRNVIHIPCVVLHTQVFVYNYCTHKFVFRLSLLLPLTFIFICLGVNWWFLHILLNQTAALVFNSFSLMFLQLWIVFARWAFIYIMLYIFHAVVFHTQKFSLPTVQLLELNVCVWQSLIVNFARLRYRPICFRKVCVTFIMTGPLLSVYEDLFIYLFIIRIG
jgi:hypothetical protein